mmetsp:Transcript_103376/g.291893  ORF Transcript_103376/g.291893 Transcript_103376/m.291893 type:complete len:94 (-) Transcript_103376:566-847(-)
MADSMANEEEEPDGDAVKEAPQEKHGFYCIPAVRRDSIADDCAEDPAADAHVSNCVENFGLVFILARHKERPRAGIRETEFLLGPPYIKFAHE